MTEPVELTPSRRHKLLGESHRLKPAVVVGQAGLSDAVVEQVKRVLARLELIKVRIPLENRDEVQAAAEELASRSQAALVAKIGKIAVLYKPKEEAPPAPPEPERPNSDRPGKPARRRPRR